MRRGGPGRGRRLARTIRFGRQTWTVVLSNEGAMSTPGLRLFLSTVTSEFRSYRDVLRADLKGPLLEIKVQEDFIHLGGDTLSLLDDYIAVCDGVIHLIGAATGARPAPVSVQQFLQRY